MLKTPIAAAVLAALSFGFAINTSAAAAPSEISQNPSLSGSAVQSPPQDNQPGTSSQSSSTDEKAKKLDTVVVSGSLINNSQIQTATPTYSITSEDIKARGFNSVTEVLQNSVFATGSVQGPQQSGGFTQGAQAVSLYGLNPEYTLILLDGRPITQFGQLYNGQSNFTNISNIPIGMIDRIDILPGGGSSIYGSQAIAGVISIVTKQHMEGVDVSARVGRFDEGGGASQRLSATFGHTVGKFEMLGSVEFDNQSPIWAYQRPYTALSDHATAVGTILDYGSIDTYTGAIQGYVSPQDNCAAMSSLYHGTTFNTTSSVKTRTGTYCGSRSVLGYATLQNQSRSYDGMLKLRYHLNDYVRFYSDVLVDWQQQKFTAGSQYIWWGPSDYPSGYIEDASTGHILFPERVFAPEEVGNNYYNQMQTQDDLMYQATVGANGTFGDSNWNWDVYFLRSGDRTTTNSPQRMAAAVDNYFNGIFGPSLGVDPNTGLNTYNPNYQAFFTPLTQAQFSSFNRNIGGFTNTWINNVRATISNDSLFALPGGDAGMAWLLESGNQAWYQPVNPLIASGQVWGQTATSGGGQRDHYASAFQFNLPVLKQVTLDLSGRYDHYSVESGSSNNKFTYKAGIEYRPFDTLLLRGNYTTSFLAPDMAALFLGPSGNYQSVTDYYLCATQGNNQNCQANFATQVQGQVLSNRKLQPTTASSYTFGFVWAPINNASFSADFLHVAITNEVAPQDADLLMRQEAQCLLGQLPANSPECAAAGTQVVRSPLTGQVTNIAQYYVNISNEVTDSLTTEAKYRFNPTPIGTFSVQLDYNDMLKHSYQIYPGSKPINQLTNPLYSSEFKSIVSGALSWELHDKWGSTLYWHRYGSSPNYIAIYDGANYPGASHVAPWITYNWSLSYSPTKNVGLSFLVNNVFNKMPPVDKTYSSFPYFNPDNYNVYGREFMAQIDIHFGGGK